ncbi:MULTISPECIES: DUF4878 domain-containing protein [Mycobacteriaceae]|uniref:Uncharacterized protein n=1 Tax=Mycolicibacterium neoaurum VKM Ac-1815D TaxID=700508 RepID=V5XJ84_MYCNE|nr:MULTISPECIES: DUF4878 domain-containing protein [Mycobacteriaceae]AXK76914.1 DUF4878 domain-containing protein [Mycolicibacterium neoaurum]KUM10335.1 hypothetical protein AVZ31_01265 [Mycolicibacterium neoaurum]
MNESPRDDLPYDPFAEPPPSQVPDEPAQTGPTPTSGYETTQAGPPVSPSYMPPPVFSAQHIPPHQPPPKRHKKTLVVLAGGAAVLVAILVVVIVVVSRGGSALTGGGSPQEAAKAYLEALASGDAEAALSLGLNAPATTDLLTDDVLRQQIEKAPITAISVPDGTAPMGDFAMVPVSAKFGDEVSSASLTMRKANGEWKVQNSAVKIDFSAVLGINKSLADLTIFGTPATGPVYVFPGWVDYGSSNANLSYKGPTLLLNQLDSFLLFNSVTPTLSPSATDAINTRLLDDLAKCTASRLFAPPGCPLKVSPAGLVDGTAQWGPLTDLGNIKQMFNPYNMTVSIVGTIVSNFTASTPGGAPSTGKITGVISGSADLSTDPPTVTYR